MPTALPTLQVDKQTAESVTECYSSTIRKKQTTDATTRRKCKNMPHEGADTKAHTPYGSRLHESPGMANPQGQMQMGGGQGWGGASG